MGITRTLLPYNKGEWPLPILGGNLLGVFCMIVFDKITIKTVKSLTYFPHYGNLPYFSLNYHVLFSDVFPIFFYPRKIPEQFTKNE